jgi:gas vesicle protein
MPSPNVVSFWLSFLGGGVVGGIVSASLTYLYNRSLAAENREHLRGLGKAGRKRHFEAFVTEWKARAERVPNPSVTANRFNSDIAEFQREFVLVRSDYGSELEALVESITERSAGQIEQGNCHQELILNLGKILRLLERA